MSRLPMGRSCSGPMLSFLASALLCGLSGAASATHPTAAELVGADVAPDPERAPLCLYVSSYHAGYSWSDRLGAALLERLGDRCDVIQYDMDTKRRRSESSVVAAAAEAFALIERHDPDVIITSDDHAAKYLIVPYLAGKSWPVVFSGINWTVEEYGLPVDNVTGIVEVAPLQPMFRQAKEIVPDAQRAAYIGKGTLTDRKNFARISRAGRLSGIEVVPSYVSTYAEWEAALTRAQDEDVVIMGNPVGIVDWNLDQAIAHAGRITRTLSLTNHDWMMPVTILGYTKLPEEQGDWAGASALAILDGVQPSSIPLVSNRKWDTWLNAELHKSSGVRLPRQVIRKSKRTD